MQTTTGLNVPIPALLGAVTWLNASLVVLFLLVSVVMILIILIQRPQGGGLSGAFGSGAGSGQTAFGARTGDALTIATIGIFVVFISMAAGLNYAIRPSKPGAAATPVSTQSPPGTSAPPATNAPQPAAPPAEKGASPAPSQPGETPAAAPPSPSTNGAPGNAEAPPAPKPAG